YFDPIVLRVQASAQRVRLETLVLPLMDNSIYTTLAQVLGGQPAALGVPAAGVREIASLWLHLPKQPLLDALGLEVPAKPDDPREPKRGGAKSTVAGTNDLKALALAFHEYAATFKNLPTAAARTGDLSPAPPDAPRKPLLSWRVTILPYIEQDALYR